MKNVYKQKREQGFTIIEVLIVLAIAGLILLIVFLAVPALQRNSRNTQRKNDVSVILGGMSEFASNNSGGLATAWNPANKQLTGVAGTTPASANLGYYTAVAFATGTQGALSSDTMRVVTGASCAAGGATTATGAAARAIAVQYEIEGGGGLVPTCQNS
jgi:prepilin-type N-terminal cleavage/methylation domain-containing protein